MRDSYADIFNLRGGAYHEACRRWPEARRAEFAAALEPLVLREGEALLDAPSGGGYLADHLPAGIRHLAVDPAACFAEYAAGRPGTEAIHAALAASGLPDASVDAVVSVAGLHHEPDRAAVYREWARVARPGARLCVVDVEAGSPEDRFLNGTVDRLNPEGHDGDFLSRAELPLLDEAHWCVESCGRVGYRWAFGSREDMGAYVRLLFGMSRAGTDRAAADAVSEHCRNGPDGQGGWALDWGLLRIVARRTDRED